MKTAYMRQVYMGTIGDLKNLEEHFSRMAKRGWMIDKIGLLSHRYHAIEPCEKRFFVDLLTQITAFDYPENEDAQDYRGFCEASGWTFVAANKQIHVFCADGENPAPIPIHTDNAIQAQNYLKSCMKYELPWLFYALLMLWLSSPLGKGAEVLLSDVSLFMAIGYCFFMIGYVWTFGFTLRWYIRTRKSKKDNAPLPKVNYRLAKLRNKVFSVSMIVFLLCMVLGVALEIAGGMPAVILLALLMPLSGVGVGLWVRRQIDTKRRTRGANIGLSILAIVIMEVVMLCGLGLGVSKLITLPRNSDSLDDRPALTLSDVGASATASRFNTRIKGTIAVPVDYEHWESSKEGSVESHVYRPVNKALTQWLYEHLADAFTERYTRWLDDLNHPQDEIVVLSSDEAAFWGAEAGMSFHYANSNAIEVLLWNDRTILRITADGANMSLDTVGEAVRRLWKE